MKLAKVEEQLPLQDIHEYEIQPMRIMMILIMMATIYDDQENFWRCNSKFEGICVKKYDLSLIGVVVTLLLVSVCFGHSASTNT